MSTGFGYYLIHIVNGWPRLKGPYDSAEAQKAAAQLLGEQGEQVFWLDIAAHSAAPSAGRVRKSDDFADEVW